MLKINKVADNRLDIELVGTMDSAMMRLALDELIEKSKGITGGQMLYTITDFTMPSFGAILVEFGYLSKMFALLGQFDRCAVLSDASWLRTAAEVEGALFPGIDIKSFEMDEGEAAEAWLCGTIDL